MNTNFDDFDTKIQPEEIFPVLSPEEIDEMAQEDLAQKAFDAGFNGEGEGSMSCDLTAKEQEIWIDNFSIGAKLAIEAQEDLIWGI